MELGALNFLLLVLLSLKLTLVSFGFTILVSANFQASVFKTIYSQTDSLIKLKL